MDEIHKQLLNAIRIINIKFKNKYDKGGNPYVSHLFSVETKIESIWDNLLIEGVDDEVILFYRKCCVVALLHDILEDTDTTENDLENEGFSNDIIDAVVAITRKKNESYIDFIERVKLNDMAKCVKIYDLEDNMDIKRLKDVTDKDLKRLKKYFYCRKYLFSSITKDELIALLKDSNSSNVKSDSNDSESNNKKMSSDVEDSKPKFIPGEYIVGLEDGLTYLIEDMDDSEYNLCLLDTTIEIKRKIRLADKEYRKWTPKDADNYDILATVDGEMIFMFNGEIDGHRIGYYYSVDKNGNLHNYPSFTMKEVIPASKAQRAFLFNSETSQFLYFDYFNNVLKAFRP